MINLILIIIGIFLFMVGFMIGYRASERRKEIKHKGKGLFVKIFLNRILKDGYKIEQGGGVGRHLTIKYFDQDGIASEKVLSGIRKLREEINKKSRKAK